MSTQRQVAPFIIWLTVGLAGLTSAAVAQQSAVVQQSDGQHPLAPSDTSSPQATLNSFVSACNDLHDLIRDGTLALEARTDVLPTTERILDCLDLSELPRELRETAGIESALFIKEVLDRIELPADDEIPATPPADAPAEPPPSSWRIPHTRLTIARVGQGPRANEYLFSPETVRRAVEFYRIARPLPYRTEGRRVSQGLYEAYVAATKKKPTIAADTSSPRGTLTRFLNSCNEFYEAVQKERFFHRANPELVPLADRVVSCLDTSQLPEYARDYFAAEAAVCLKEVLDRIPLPLPEEIPGVESLEGTAGAEPFTRWQVPGTQITISRMQDGPRRGEFLFSAETVSQAPQFYERFLSRPYRTEGREVSEGFYEWWLSSPAHPLVAEWVAALPDWSRRRILGAAIWQWFGLLLMIPLALATMALVSRIGRSRGEQTRGRGLLRYWLTLLFPIVAMLIPLGFKYFVGTYLSLRGDAHYVTNFCADLIFLLAVMALILGGSSRVAETTIALRRSPSSGLDANVIRIICRVLGIVAAAVVFLEGGRYLGFPITTLIASAGIGGLALALSAQNVIKGMFGTLTILLDRPYRVGDRIIACGHDGIVEEIGLRTTRIRAFLTDHLVSLPNSEMAETQIENIGRRKHIRRMTDLHIPLDTPRENVASAVAIIRAALENHEGLDPEFPPRVYFNEFNPDSFNIRIICWYSPPQLWDYYAFCEKINMEIFAAFEDQGVQFSLPVRQTYWKHDDEQGPLEISLVDRQHRSGRDGPKEVATSSTPATNSGNGNPGNGNPGGGHPV
ncbi:mechanosensitive ion channel family protein [Maioricimonas sp. JC845]|uniref:mechanosensitive ion channel family protein n=1 Tax=Maioricimonas sp. JC845 TaxID=3232138 RepID=UPI0034575BB9